MHLMVLACDLDGTLAENGQVAAETWERLRQAKTAGFGLLLVTGRTLQSFAPEGPYAELYDAIVAEDGAVVYFPRRDIVVLPFGHLDPALLQRFATLSIPLERGMAIVATHVPHDAAILDVLRELGGGATVEYNRGAVMVLPPGATKGTGLQFALRELGSSPRNVVACGDAENDRSLFEGAELAVAVANAAPAVQALADVVLGEPNGAGVRALIADLLAGHRPIRHPRPERQLILGHGLDGASITLDPFALLTGNLGIVGDSGSGKSWLAGLLAEEMLKQGYQICVIDPEGDYRNLRAFPHTMLVGGQDMMLPPIADALSLSEYAGMSLVFDLSLCSVAERNTYVLKLLREMWCLRAGRGRPHWVLLDESQSFCPTAGGEFTDVLLNAMCGGGFAVVTYRPSQVAPILLEALDHWLLTRLSPAEEIATVAPFLSGPNAARPALARLPLLPLGQAYLSFRTEAQPAPATHSTVVFRTGPRTVPHIRHLHKYLRATLPQSQRFYFCDAAGRGLGTAAASLWEFCAILGTLPIDSLRYHLQRGDFERWIRDVLRDNELARRLNRLAHRDLPDTELRHALVAVVGDRYNELNSLV